MSYPFAPHEPPAAQPHDGLVKYTFSRREHAVGLLRALLPPPIEALVDWAALEPVKDSFIDPELRTRYADVLFSARVGEKRAFFYLLVEHRRDVERFMMLRFERYMGRVWDRLVHDEPTLKKLPPILGVLLSNAPAGWTAATRFEDIVDLPDDARAALAPYTPSFAVRLVDLCPAEASAIVEEMLTAFGKVVLWALSVANDDERFLAEIDRMRDAIDAALTAPDAHDALVALLRYLSSTHRRLGAKKIGSLLKSGAKMRREKKMIDDGLEELRQEGRAKTLLQQLTARFGRVPAAAKRRILAATEAEHDRWALRVLTARSLDAVLDGPAPRAKKEAPLRKAARA